ncbi:MAG TPA: peptidylprolyl isomerase [Gemmatimonadales bacterium]|nr:peptidylprolyl isomerase [Gemmatimonadales bacterium]
MRRLSLVLLALTPLLLAGCQPLRDAFSARERVAARANDQTLTVDQLARWAGPSKQVPLDPATLARVSRYWVEYALFAEALATGKNLRDSATTVRAMWPMVSGLKMRRFHDRLTAGNTLTAEQVESAYAVGPYRLFQHILFRVTPPAGGDTTAARRVDSQKRRQAEQVLAQARTAGSRFAQLATRYSEDPGSKVNGGSLGLSTRGAYVSEFDNAAWELPPGAVSPVVRSQFGYHIIRRPPLAEVRDSFRVELQNRLGREIDSLYNDSLTIKRKVQPVGRAAAYAKAAVQDLDAARASHQVLVKYRGGSLKVSDFVRWLDATDPRVLSAFPQARDEEINDFLKGMARQQLMLEQADSAGVTLTAEDWQSVRAQHDSTMVMVSSFLSLSPEVLRDSAGKSPEDRINFALGRVNDYFDRVFHGRARFYPLPAFLADTLLAQANWDVDEAGVRRAVERGQEIRSDSTSAPRIAPAPGPAPVDTTQRRTPR